MMKLLMLAVLLLFLISPKLVDASPIGVIKKPDGTVITIYNEACTLKEFVINLPARITWEENGKITEGCAAIRLPNLGYLVLTYFADKTVAIIPLSDFTPVSAT